MSVSYYITVYRISAGKKSSPEMKTKTKTKTKTTTDAAETNIFLRNLKRANSMCSNIRPKIPKIF